jgi:hypothetical protein
VDEPPVTARDAAGSRRGLVVELVGIPGAGKSRRVRILAETLTRRGIAVAKPQARFDPSVPTGPRLARKTLASGAAALSAPATTVRVLNGLVRSRQPGPADIAGRAVQWLVAQDVLARAARRDGVSLVDEGLIQALWSTGLRGDVSPVLAALDGSARWHSPDLLVVVRVSPEIALARLSARASRHSRTQLLGQDEQLAELRRGAELLDRLVTWWSADAPDSRQVLEVSGTDDGDVMAEPFLEQIAAGLRG